MGTIWVLGSETKARLRGSRSWNNGERYHRIVDRETYKTKYRGARPLGLVQNNPIPTPGTVRVRGVRAAVQRKQFLEPCIPCITAYLRVVVLRRRSTIAPVRRTGFSGLCRGFSDRKPFGVSGRLARTARLVKSYHSTHSAPRCYFYQLNPTRTRLVAVQDALKILVNRVVLTRPHGCEQIHDFIVTKLVGGVVKTRYFQCVAFDSLFILGSVSTFHLAQKKYEAYPCLVGNGCSYGVGQYA